MYTLYRYIQYIKIADYLQQNIIINFIIKLPKSEDISTRIKYNSILVIVDKFTKYTHLIFYKKESTTKQMIYVVLDRVVKYYGIPENIMLDRDKIFKSNF